MLDFMHLSATGVAEIDESTNLNWCPHTSVYVVYIQSTTQWGRQERQEHREVATFVANIRVTVKVQRLKQQYTNNNLFNN
jgi:hypothetical protein